MYIINQSLKELFGLRSVMSNL